MDMILLLLKTLFKCYCINQTHVEREERQNHMAENRRDNMRNERMYAELVELLKTDSASGRESAVAELLRMSTVLPSAQ